jgi:hypothetical protein
VIRPTGGCKPLAANSEPYRGMSGMSVLPMSWLVTVAGDGGW